MEDDYEPTDFEIDNDIPRCVNCSSIDLEITEYDLCDVCNSEIF